MKILISTTGSNTLVELADGLPDLSAYSEPTKSILQNAFDEGNYVDLPDAPTTQPPGWEVLLNHILGGDLYPLYARLTAANFVNPATATNAQIGEANNIAVASGKLDQAVQVTRIESAVQAAFGLLYQTSSYRFTTEEKALWDSTVQSLGFSPVMYLP